MTSQKEILAEIKSFYLFKNKDHDLCNYNLSKISSLRGSNTLTEQDSKNLEGILTLYEISVVLKTMKKQTSYFSHWEQVLRTKITEKEWKSIYQNCLKTVEDNDLVLFQYRLLNRILGTNKYLVKIKQKVNANCNFCKKETENITHLFIECNFVKSFWTDLKRNLHFSLGVDLTINPSDIISGTLGSNNKKT